DLLRSRASFRWTLVVAAVFLVLVVVSIRAELGFAGRRIGVSVDAHAEGGIAVLDISSGSPAERAGLVAGDRMLSLEGQPLNELSDFDRIAQGFVPRRPVEIEVARGERTLQVELVPGMPVELGTLLLRLFVLAIYLALGLVAAALADGDRRALLLAGFALAVAAELALPQFSLAPGVAQVAAATAFALLSGLQFGLELHLAAVIPEPATWLVRRPWLARVPYVVGLSLGAFVALAAIADDAGIAGADDVHAFSDNLLDTWMLPIWALSVAGLIGWRALHHPEPRGRQQAALVLLGIAPWVTVVLYETVAGIFDFGLHLPDAVWSLALLAYPLAIFSAVFLYRLFDLELVVRKSFVYFTLTSLLVLIFYFVVGAGGALFARQIRGGAGSIWVISAATLAMGLLFNPLRVRLERLIDRRLFPERQELRSRLIELAAGLPAQGKLPRMGVHLASELARIFATDRVAVWITMAPHGQLVELASSVRSTRDLERTALIAADDPAIRRLAHDLRPTPAATLAALSPAIADRLREAGAEIVVPLGAQRGIVGLLLVGGKRDRGRFVAEELELLNLLAHHAATVFENARLFDSATFEGLTGLYRREAVLEILDREWSRSHRYDRPLAVVVADLDHFKSVNDRFGHLGGDQVLQRVAAELRALLRETDFIGRYGGEEFLIVLPETTLEGALVFAEKVRARIAELPVAMEGGAELHLTLSLGAASRAEVRGDHRVRGRALIAAADEALYEAKNAGRNRVRAAASTRP
ncbi:MAG TPA: diguanylate cyclase, partial [Thermoanaerobaculia bacterium]|nr:diguanylate cyclase [Thermoanaerobaculia bacterium]